MSRVNARTLAKYGFHRTPSEDFSDDGTRFLMFEYKGLQMSYAYDGDYHYMSLRPDYTPDLDYKTYRLFPSYKNADEFNGQSEVDLDKLKENAEALVRDINLWVEDNAYFTKAEAKKIDDYKKMLEEEYMSETDDQKAKDAVWNQAWEYGHSSGLEEVRSYYIDLADLAYKCMFR